MTQGRNLRGSCPVFLFMKRPAPNTPKVISNTPNRNKFSPKVFLLLSELLRFYPHILPFSLGRPLYKVVEAREGFLLSLPSVNPSKQWACERKRDQGRVFYNTGWLLPNKGSLFLLNVSSFPTNTSLQYVVSEFTVLAVRTDSPSRRTKMTNYPKRIIFFG